MRGEMSVAVCSNSQEEYDDDFERDLDWLISEDESRNEQQDPDDDDDNDDGETQIDRVLDEDEKTVEEGGERRSNEERWPTPMEPPSDGFSTEGEYLTEDDEDEEKKSLLLKIEEANRQLQDQEPPDELRRRRLQFKDTLVDLVVPAQNYSAPCTVPRDTEVDGEVLGQMLRLKISQQEESEGENGEVGGGGGRGRGGYSDVGGVSGGDGRREGVREGRVLVERDGKFDLVSLKEVESQGLLPPLPVSHNDGHHGYPRTQPEPVKSPSLSLTPPFNSAPLAGMEPRSTPPTGAEPRYSPHPPPARSRARPNSAIHTQRPAGGQQGGGKRRVQSASEAPSHGTFTLSSEQKELLNKQQQQRQRLAREEEERKHEEEEQKRQENELAFRAWLAKKRLQLQDERRVQRAQQMERMSCERECADPEEAFRLWLQKKREQQVKERQLEEMKRLEHDSALYLRTPEERDKAFTLWLRRKRAEKRAEQQAARERSRRLVLEERRARRMQNLLCTVNESRTFRFNEPYGYRF